MGNAQTSLKVVRQSSGPSSSKNSSRRNKKRSSDDKNRLEGEDLDELYAFIMDMKEGDADNKAALDEFVLIQSSRLGWDDESIRNEILTKVLEGKSLATKTLEPPVQQIVITRDTSIEVKPPHPSVSLSA